MSKKKNKKVNYSAQAVDLNNAGAFDEAYTQPDGMEGLYDEDIANDYVAAAPAEAPQEAPATDDAYAAATEPATYKFKNATFKKLQPNGPIPVIAPVNPVQLTPIVVPVAIVPYATQNQPMLQYADQGGVYQGESVGSYDNGAGFDNGASGFGGGATTGFGNEAAYPAATAGAASIDDTKPSGKANKALAFFAFLFGLLYLVPMILGYMEVELGSISFAKSNLIGEIMAIFDASDIMVALKENIGALLYAVGAVLSVVVIIMSLVALGAKQAPKVFVAALLLAIFAIAGLLCNLILVAGFSTALTTDGLGYLLMTVFALVSAVMSVVMQIMANKQ